MHASDGPLELNQPLWKCISFGDFLLLNDPEQLADPFYAIFVGQAS